MSEDYARGGFIQGDGSRVSVTLAPEECVIVIRNGIYQCARPEHRHDQVGATVVGTSAAGWTDLITRSK